MIVGIENIYFYMGLTPTGSNDSVLAQMWLDEQAIPYQFMWYADQAQHADVFAALNTWGIGTFSDFPFVIYDEKHDDFTTTKQALIGLDAIRNSNLVQLHALGA